MNCIHSHEGGAYCDKHDHGAVTVGCCGEESCPDREVQTNGDLVRQMSDDGIEDWYWWMHKEMMRYTDSRVFVHDWLKAPADKEAGE